MEDNLDPTPLPPPADKRFQLSFHGNGGEYFGIVIVNWLLTVFTLGLYYPWAKARQLQYLYGATEFEANRFRFHGTGQEMFKGFIKAMLLFGLLLAAFIGCAFTNHPFLGMIILYAGIFSLIPLAIHGSYRYRMSRTSWRGIRFGYRGDRNELFVNFFKWTFFTVITFGIYGAWMSMNLRNYVLNNMRFGNMKFRYKGNGGDYFVLNLKGYFLTIFTLGIYFAWWQRDLFNYYVNNLSLQDEERVVRFRSTMTGGSIFGIAIVNILILIFTLGLGYAWVVTRTLQFVFSHVEPEGNIDFNNLQQTEGNYTDATGEDLSDLLDFGFVI
jgi:uncharacterized membrane protein YjgN (DUF898 family)